MTITAAADGSALGNPGPAGWAWYIDESTWRAGGWPHGTNNMGELKAVLDLLESTGADPSVRDEELLILCDSQYVINSVTKWMPGWKRKGWKKRDGKPVLNVELMQAIDSALQGRRVHFEWVKGHAGHPMNEAADRLANAAATAFQNHQKPREGPGLSGSGDDTTPADCVEATAPVDRMDAGTVAATANEVIGYELAWLSDAVRSDPQLAEELLHPEMTEIDSSGRASTRDEVLAALSPLVGFDAIDELHTADITATKICPNVFLVTYGTSGPRGDAQSTSLWIHDGERWTLRHHQETPTSH